MPLITDLYDISSSGNLRGKASEGFIRPTLKQFFTSKTFNEVDSFPNCTGGNIVDYSYSGNNYRVHTFLNSGTFIINELEGVTLDILIVGGGGGNQSQIGGGAGGFVYYKQKSMDTNSYTITIGESNEDSTFETLTTALAGGKNSIGGSGSGHSSSTLFYAGTVNQGNSGGQYFQHNYGGSIGYGQTYGAGGGAKEAVSRSGFSNGQGGDGYQEGIDSVYDFTTGTSQLFEINGLGTHYAGGGAGGIPSYNIPGSSNLGGAGGGGNGYCKKTGVNGTSGAPNTGGGAGGDGSALSGGSGIIIVRYSR